MPDQPSRSPRQVMIADHLWETFALMSRDMGVDRDSLFNQALFALARQNGYIAPVPVVRSGGEAASDAAPRMTSPGAYSGARVDQVGQTGNLVAAAAAPTPSPRPTAPPVALPPLDEALPPLAPPPARTSVTASAADPAPPVAPPPAFFAPPSAVDVPMSEEMQVDPVASDPIAPAPDDPVVEGPQLVLYAEGREVDRVRGPRFLIGRGKHCDLIINSGKVSREHAAIIREGDEFFMEDLGSSNGTWFDKKRITRRRIEDGDEYFVCSEKITCRLS